jgi:hypothetical protein
MVMEMRVVPSSSTMERAWSGSWAVSAMFAENPPGMLSGNSFGVMSDAAAPAERDGAAQGALRGRASEIARREVRRFMGGAKDGGGGIVGVRCG